MNKHAKGKSCACENSSDSLKGCGCNDWDSVPKTYDAAESCHKHEKTAANNQWCSCNK